MSYRPQFSYALPPRCKEESFIYQFDSGNTPGLGVAGPIQDVGLVTQQDAPFIWRGLQVFGTDFTATQVFPQVYTLGSFQLKDPFGEYLTPVTTFAVPFLWAESSGISQQALGALIPLDDEIICPPSSVIILNSTLLISLVLLHGVKRYGSAVCR